MNEIVNRLRDAAGALGETVQDVPDFRRYPSHTRRPWAMPLVAAAAVTTVVAAGVTVVQGDGRGDGGVVSAVGTAPERFAVVGDSSVTFHRSDTGHLAARLSLGPEQRFSLVDAARGAFYVTVRSGSCETLFLRVTFQPDGALRRETLPITPPKGSVPTSLAVSADGTRLAYGLVPCQGGTLPARLGVTDLTTGKSRVFGSPRGGDVRNVSITADGGSVAFQRGPGTNPTSPPTRLPAPAKPPSSRPVLEATPMPTVTVTPAPRRLEVSPSAVPRPTLTVTVTPVPAGRRVSGGDGPEVTFLGPDPSEVWVLDTAAEGDDLDGARKVLLRTASGTPAGVQGVRIGADGRSFVAALGRIVERAAGGGSQVVAEIARFGAGDGRKTGALYHDDRGGLQLVDTDGSGEHLLVRRGPEFGVVNSGRYRTLRSFRQPAMADIGW
ncbi:hypothetical protein [Streptosporangium sp. CA-115845]|uniref:hypothetical protein n=1 Tax=Streptosporangium sp. CA-115845 TaxID=3240071 RepID=UPI003D8D3917